jgi:hypothetical protein
MIHLLLIMTAKPSKEELLLTAVVAGIVTLIVNVLAPWILHWVNPAGPKSSIAEANGVALRTLPAEIRQEFNKSVTFRSWLVSAFPLNTFAFQPFAGQPQPKQCVGQVLFETGSIDEDCGQRFSNWAYQTMATNAANILAIQDQAPPPPDKEATLARFNEVQKNATILADAIAKLKDASGSKSGEFIVSAVLLNDGDGDDVLYPDAWLTCDKCGIPRTPLFVEQRYLTLKAHSFLPITCSLAAGKISADDLRRIRNAINASDRFVVTACLHVASRPSLCSSVEIR